MSFDYYCDRIIRKKVVEQYRVIILPKFFPNSATHLQYKTSFLHPLKNLFVHYMAKNPWKSNWFERCCGKKSSLKPTRSFKLYRMSPLRINKFNLLGYKALIDLWIWIEKVKNIKILLLSCPANSFPQHYQMSEVYCRMSDTIILVNYSWRKKDMIKSNTSLKR